MSKPVKIKIRFAPGCFDNFEGSQEELDEFIDAIKKMAESGELVENAIRVEDLDDYMYDDSHIYDDDTSENETPRRLH